VLQLAMSGMIHAKPAPASDAAATFPPKVPDSANPFAVADASKLPTPLPPAPGGQPKLECSIIQTTFDGVGATEMSLKGPDFELQMDPFTDWYVSSPGAGEAVAFVYGDNPKVRLSFALYGPKSWLPDLNTPTLIRYMAAMRQRDPKAFTLITPFPADGGGVNGASFRSFTSVRVDYYFMPPSGKVKDAMEYNDYFINLNGFYILEMRLSGPMGWPERLRGDVEFHLRRSFRKKGLGAEGDEAPKPAAGNTTAGNTTTAPAKSAE
jgi:hypothetical protein